MKFLASELNTCVLAIAHPVADGHKMAGSARLFQASDFVLEITPDEVAADGRKSATLSSRKSKEDEGFPPAAYEILPCRWEDQERDEDGELTGGTVLVKSATIKLLSQQGAAPSPDPARQPAPLPVLQDVPRRAKRNGIRRDHGGLHSVPDAAPRRDLGAALTALQCPDCSRPGGGMTCDTRYPGSKLIPVSFDPLRAVHADRAVAAWMAGYITETELDTVLAAAALDWKRIAVTRIAPAGTAGAILHFPARCGDRCWLPGTGGV